MLNSNLVKKAHKMAKEIKAQYPEVDYKFQYGLCLSYLLEEEKTATKDTLAELKAIADAHNINYKVWEKGDKKRLYFTGWSGKYQKKYGFYDYNTQEYSTFDRYTKNYSLYNL